MRQLDPGFALKLAKTIRPAAAPLAKGSPLGSQFFADDLPVVTHLSTDELASSLAGAGFNEREQEIKDLAFQQQVRDQTGLPLGMPRPSVSGDVSMIGSGRSAWTPAKNVSIASGAKALLLNRLAKAANPSAADTAILTATLKSIVQQLLGVNVESVDPSVLKSKLAATIKSRPDLGLRLQKALGTAPDVDISLDALIAAGAKVSKTGSTLTISV